MVHPGTPTRLQVLEDIVPAALELLGQRMVGFEGHDAHQLLEVLLRTGKLDSAGGGPGAVEQALAVAVHVELVQQQMVGLLGQYQAHELVVLVRPGHARQVGR